MPAEHSVLRWWMLPLAAAVGAGLALLFAPRPPAQLEHVQDLKLQELQLRGTTIDRKEGPVRVVDRWRAPAAPGCPPVERERIVEKGPAETHQAAVETAGRTLETRDVLRVVQAPPPRWAVFGGLQAYPEVLPVAGVGLRLFGPIWAEGWIRPRLQLAPPALGLQLRVTW